MIAVHHSDCVKWLRDYAARIAAGEDLPLFDSCVTDPPYHLTSGPTGDLGMPSWSAKKKRSLGAKTRGFMGKTWDGGDVAQDPETWAAVYDCLKPGAHLVAFAGTRTYHRMVCAIEDAGFEIRDQLAYCYGSGFPKSHDVSKGIDRHNGDVRAVVGEIAIPGKQLQQMSGNPQDEISKWTGKKYDGPASADSQKWQGWGTALKPAWEPIVLARKPLSEKTVAANVLKWGTGAINVDACRIGTDGGGTKCTNRDESGKCRGHRNAGQSTSGETFHGPESSGARWPANILHDGSDEVLAGFPVTTSGSISKHHVRTTSKTKSVFGERAAPPEETFGDSGSAARFFYSAKAGPLDRLASQHATIKPVDLMRWLCKLITPPGGHILEPFGGSGTTGIAALADGFDCTMIELEADHVADIERKLAILRGEGRSLIVEHNERKEKRAEPLGGLFA